MKLIELPVNTLVELQFYFAGKRYRVGVGLLYKGTKAVYVSAIKNAGKTVPAAYLYNVHLVYRTPMGLYIFKKVELRSISYNGQKLYAVQTENEAYIVDHRNAYRVYIGKNISAKVIVNEKTESIRCILKDISMSDMGILYHAQLDPTSQIEISFRVNQNDKETLLGKVVRVEEYKNGSGYLYICEFSQPNETIGKFITYQINKINKGNEGKEAKEGKKD